MVFPENTAQPKTVNKPEVRQHNSKHQRNNNVFANHIFLHSVSCHQAPLSHSYSWRPLTLFHLGMHRLCQCLAHFLRSYWEGCYRNNTPVGFVSKTWRHEKSSRRS